MGWTASGSAEYFDYPASLSAAAHTAWTYLLSDMARANEGFSPESARKAYELRHRVSEPERLLAADSEERLV